MCGIVAWLNLDLEQSINHELLSRMTDVLRHRGPDTGDIWIRNGIGFGHRRLKIIDLESGNQPMHSADGSVSIVFNGEIYNYLELRAELERAGAMFRTKSDTEVLLEAYRHYDVQCLKHFRGMFAFAIWDATKQRLFAARDRMGQKPLFYWWEEGKRLLLASEAKAILEHPECPRRLNVDAFALYLQLLYVPEGWCIFQGLEKLPPAHYLLVEEGRLSVHRYWEVRHDLPAPSNREEALEGIQERLNEAVRLRLRSDVPLGAFLSGGIDSSLIVLTAAKQLDKPLKTITVRFPGLIDETPYARQVAQHCGSNHVELDVTPDKLDELLPQLAALYDEPFADTSNVPTYYISQKAREQVKVVLSGDGGDELFAGYTSYQEHLRVLNHQKTNKKWTHRLIHAFAPLLQKWSYRLPGVVNNALDPLAQRVRQVYRVEHLSSYADVLQRHASFSCNPHAIAALSPNLFSRLETDLKAFLKLQRDAGEPMRTVFDYDINQYMPADWLKKVDIASMAHGLEVRSPFLDHEVVQYAMSIPPAWKLSVGDLKLLLKKLVARQMGKEFVNRPKQGFGAPMAWLRDNSVREIVQTVLMDTNMDDIWWNQTVLHDMVKNFYRGHNLGLTIWIWLCAELWRQAYRVMP